MCNLTNCDRHITNSKDKAVRVKITILILESKLGYIVYCACLNAICILHTTNNLVFE